MKLLAFLLIAVSCTATAPVKIPLSEVWGFAIPGTIPVQDLEPDFDVRRWSARESTKRSAVERIMLALNPTDRDNLSRPVFLVPGEGKEALAAIDGVLSRNTKPLNSPKMADRATVFFFVESQPATVLLHSVELDGHRLIIKCELQGMRGLSGPRFALIPLTLPEAEFLSVEIELTTSVSDDPTGVPVSDSHVRRVCQSGKFTLYKKPGD